MMKDQPPRGAAADISRIEAGVWIVAIAALSVFQTGYAEYVSNQSIQLSLVEYTVAPEAFAADPFAQTLGSYAAPIWYVVAAAARYMPVAPVLLGGFLAARFVLVAGLYALGWCLTNGNRVGGVAAAALVAVAPAPLLADGTIAPRYFEHTSVAVACGVWAMVCAMRGMLMGGAVLWALTFCANPLYGVFSAPPVIALGLGAPRVSRKRHELLIAALAALAIVALPAAWMVRASGASAEDAALWLHALSIYYPHHFFPDSWELRPVLKTLLLCVAAALVCVRRDSRAAGRFVLIMTASTALALVVAMYGGAAQQMTVILLQAPRALDFWYVTVPAAALAVAFASGGGLTGVTRRALALPGMAALAHTSAAAAGLLCVLPFLLWKRVAGSYAARVLMGLGLALVLLLRAAEIRTRWEPRHTLPEPRLAAWARENSSVDSVFLIPLDWGEFRPRAGRSVFVTWKDGAALLWHKPYYGIWLQRLHALGIDTALYTRQRPLQTPDCAHIVGELTDAQITELAARYCITHWVIADEKPTRFEEAFRASGYKVVRVSGAAAEARPPLRVQGGP